LYSAMSKGTKSTTSLDRQGNNGVSNFTDGADDMTGTRSANLGGNVSGRNWKVRANKRTSTMITKTISNNKSKSWEQKAAEQLKRKENKEKEEQMMKEKKDKILDKKKRKFEQEKRRQENEYKATQTQALTKNVDGKLKAMSKKQLRSIKKTRINTKTGVIELVDAHKK